MKNYRKTSHSVYDLKIHMVWITKYRKPVLFGNVATRLRDLVREICKSMDVEIIRGHVSKDHVHLFMSVPPQVSVSTLAQRVKGKTPCVRVVVERIPTFGQKVLGSSSLGARLFCCIIGQCHRRSHYAVHRDAGYG